MKYLENYISFMESNDTELSVKELKKDLKKKGIDPNDKEFQQKLAKNLADQLKKQLGSDDPEIKVNIDEIIKESLDNKIFESANTGLINDIIHVWHEFEGKILANCEDAEVISHDILGKVKKENWIVKLIKSIGAAGEWVIGLFETIIIWISRNIFGSSASTSVKSTKMIMIGLAISGLISAILLWPSTAAGILGGGSIWVLLTKITLSGSKFLKIVSGVWKVIKSIILFKKSTEFGGSVEITTISEFMDSIESKYTSGHNFGSRSIQRANAWQSHLKEDEVNKMSEIFKSLLDNKEKLRKVPYFNYHAGLSDDKSSIDDAFKYFKIRINTDKNSSNSNKSIINDILGGDSRYKGDWAGKKANILYKAMSGFGTREEDIFKVFKNIDPESGKSYGVISEKDFFAIYLAFNLQKNKDLIEWLFDDMNSSELNELSDILDKVKWSDGYNIPNILRGELNDYLSNTKWILKNI